MVQNLRFIIVGKSDNNNIFSCKLKNWFEFAYYHFYEYPNIHMVKRHYGIITEDFKLVHYHYDIDKWEQYDRRADRNEMKNVYNDPIISKYGRNCIKN